MSAQQSLHKRKNRRRYSASSFARAENLPCFQLARRERSNPAAVRGPVLAPPCIRQRPLCIAGALHSSPFRVLAPHRGAVLGSPVGLLFFRCPRRFAWGSFLVLGFIPTPLGGMTDSTDNGLTAPVHVNVFDLYSLLAFTAVCLQRLYLLREGP